MKVLSIGFVGLMALASASAVPTEARYTDLETRNQDDFRWLSKRCCINCLNPYAKCSVKDKREAFDTEAEALFGNEKRCCINCMNPCSNCSGKGPGGSTCSTRKRDEGVSQWPAKRCCINCLNPYAKCNVKDKREAVDTFEDAVSVKA